MTYIYIYIYIWLRLFCIRHNEYECMGYHGTIDKFWLKMGSCCCRRAHPPLHPPADSPHLPLTEANVEEFNRVDAEERHERHVRLRERQWPGPG